MKTVLKALKYAVLIPFIVSIPGFVLSLCGSFWVNANLLLLPLLTAAIYVLFRKKLDPALAGKVNGGIALTLLVVFTGMMLLAGGNSESRLVSCFGYFLLPYFPMELLLALMGKSMVLYVSAILCYAAAWIVSAVYERKNVRRIAVPALVAVACAVTSTVLYLNRPEVKYAGHGFDYMHGYSSTDFTDYTVYAENSKLARLDHEPSFRIENEEEMPVLDGAEACYPLYAAFAKAVYRDIDRIEREDLDSHDRYQNGRIVTMTNTVFGFERLLDRDAEKFGNRVDMFFGAAPSESQLEAAKEAGVELEITPIGREAFVFFVEEDNPIEGLTSEELRAIYHGDFENWKELGGKDREILAFQRPENSGSQTMMRYFMGDLPLREPRTYEKVDAMAGIIREVAQYANERGAIGYSFRYFLEELNQEDGVRMLAVDGVYPTLETIENGTYPLTVNVCLVTRRDETNPNVGKLRDFILSDDGQELLRRTGYAGIGKAD